jgi:DNA repair exonuclease SbcCD ATPase subunit
MSQEKQLKQLLERFEKKKAELSSIGVFRKGSITKRWTTCGNPRCQCHSDDSRRHGPYYWWTTKEKGRTQAIFVPKEFLSEARTCLKNYKQLQRQLKTLSEVSERIIRKKLELLREARKHNP